MNNPERHHVQPSTLIDMWRDESFLMQRYSASVLRQLRVQTDYPPKYEMRNVTLNGNEFVSQKGQLLRLSATENSGQKKKEPSILIAYSGEKLHSVKEFVQCIDDELRYRRKVPVSLVPKNNELVFTLNTLDSFDEEVHHGMRGDTHRETESAILLASALRHFAKTGSTRYTMSSIVETAPPHCISLDILRSEDGRKVINATETLLGESLSNILHSVGIETIDTFEATEEPYVVQQLRSLEIALNLTGFDKVLSTENILPLWFTSTFRYFDESAYVWSNSTTNKTYTLRFAPSVCGYYTSFNNDDIRLTFDDLVRRSKYVPEDFMESINGELFAMNESGLPRAGILYRSNTYTDGSYALCVGSNHQDIVRYFKEAKPEWVPDVELDITVGINIPRFTKSINSYRSVLQHFNTQNPMGMLPMFDLQFAVSRYGGVALGSPDWEPGEPNPKYVSKGKRLIREMVVGLYENFDPKYMSIVLQP